MATEELPGLIADLYRIVDRLESLFTRKFTLDGHLVGSIGEVVAAHFYNLRLADQSTEAVDAWTKGDPERSIQIKLTQGASIQISKTKVVPNHLVVLRLDRKEGFKEFFNGNFPSSFLESKKVSKRLEWSVSLSSLEALKQIDPLPDEGPILQVNQLFKKRGKP